MQPCSPCLDCLLHIYQHDGTCNQPMSKDSHLLSATSDGEPFSAEDDDTEGPSKIVRQNALSSSKRTIRLQPLELEMDPVVAWAYRPSVLVILSIIAGSTVLFAYHTENLVVPRKV